MMAQKVIVQLTDDIDGGEATRTVQFGIHGKTYEIDLNDDNAAELDAALEKFIKAGRTVSTGRSTRSRRASSGAAASGVDPAAVRKWAEAQGIEVNPRGRIKKDIVDQYIAAGN